MNFDSKRNARMIARNEKAEEREVMKQSQGPRSRSAVVKPSNAAAKPADAANLFNQLNEEASSSVV